MKTKTIKIISIILGIFAFLLCMYSFRITSLSILGNLFVVLSGLVGGLLNLIITFLISSLVLISGLLILFNSISFSQSEADPYKKPRHLIIIGLFLLVYPLYQYINIYFQSDRSSTINSLFLVVSLSILGAGILSITTSFLRIYFIHIPKSEDSYITKRKKFLKQIQKPALLALLFLTATIIFNIYKINEIDFRGNINDSELDGKLVFLRINSDPFSPKSEPENYYNDNNLCMVDLRYPTEINCFDKSEDDPYWGPDGENIFYVQKNEDGIYHTVVYNIINGEKEVLNDNQKTYNDYYGLYGTLRGSQEKELIRIKSTLPIELGVKILSPHNYNTRMSISPDGKKITYFNSVRSIYILKEGDRSKEQNINEHLITPLEDKLRENLEANYPIWYSNTQILFKGTILSNKISTAERYLKGFFLMDEDGSNVRLLVPNNDDYFYYGSPNLYR